MLTEEALVASISRVVDYINGYRSSFGLCKRFVPIKIRNLFDDGKVDDEAVKCLEGAIDY